MQGNVILFNLRVNWNISQRRRQRTLTGHSTLRYFKPHSVMVIALNGAKTWTLRAVDQKHMEKV
jgi:hypothetical protein